MNQVWITSLPPSLQYFQNFRSDLIGKPYSHDPSISCLKLDQSEEQQSTETVIMHMREEKI